MVSIAQMRKDSKLQKNFGYRERAVLFSPDAKVKIARDYPPTGSFAEVTSKREGDFVIAIKDNIHGKKGTIVG
jgi:hypothetical protein